MEKTALKYGGIIALTLIGYFLMVKLLGLHENPWLRLLNGIIMGYGLYRVIKDYKLRKGNAFYYFDGFKLAILAGFVATMIFALFMGIYMFHIDTFFVENLMNTWLDNYAESPAILLFIILIEGFASSVVLSLLFMQKFKPSWNIT